MAATASSPLITHAPAHKPFAAALAFSLLLAACIARLWLVPLPSSLWVDEMVTAFVVHYPDHPSYAIAPQVPASIYYWLPRASTYLFGNSEAVWRLPSLLVMGAALFLIARIAARLIHPRAAWFAVFACLGVRGFNYYAIDARPYALGICIAAAGFYFLIRWLDAPRNFDAILFVLFGAILWRVHLLYWPFYMVFAIYAAARIAKADTRIGWTRAIAFFGALAITLVPVAIHAISILRGASEHVIAPVPSFREFQHAIRWNLIAVAGAGAWLLTRFWRGRPQQGRPSGASLAALVAWWLFPPVSLYIFSVLTGNSVFISRYISLCLPGIALAATAAVAFSIRESQWTAVSLVLAAGVLLVMGEWNVSRPSHGDSDWRSAAHAANQLAPSPAVPVICPSPFIEARSPAWSPNYPLPGFLYAHLPFYPLAGKVYLFPFESSDGTGYASTLLRQPLLQEGRFILYGGRGNVRFWRKWFAARPELNGWTNQIHEFGDVWVVQFDKHER